MADRGAEDALTRAVAERFPNVTAIGVREALEAVADALGKIGMAARATAGLALVAGVLVLAGAIAAGRRERTRDAVILKVDRCPAARPRARLRDRIRPRRTGGGGHRQCARYARRVLRADAR